MAVALAILTVPLGAEAPQAAPKVYRIGYVRAERPPAVDIEAFREGLRAHGYVEGTNVVIEYRWADGNEERLRSLVAELGWANTLARIGCCRSLTPHTTISTSRWHISWPMSGITAFSQESGTWLRS
jgi:hypothetical protein